VSVVGGRLLRRTVRSVVGNGKSVVVEEPSDLLVSGRVGVGWGFDESAFEWWRVGVDSESLLVDGDVVVEPAQGRQVLRVVGSAVGSQHDVVWFESVAAGAA